MLWFETFYEAVGLPKLNGVAVNGYFCEPPRLLLIRGADVNPIDNVAGWSDHIGAIFFHRTLYSSELPNVKAGTEGLSIENGDGLTSPHAVSGTRHFVPS
jgi:hypothetical protein